MQKSGSEDEKAARSARSPEKKRMRREDGRSEKKKCTHAMIASIYFPRLSRDNSIELYAMETRSSSSYGESNRHCGGRAFLSFFLFFPLSNVSVIESVRGLESGGSFNFLNFESGSWEDSN